MMDMIKSGDLPENFTFDASVFDIQGDLEAIHVASSNIIIFNIQIGILSIRSMWQ